MMQTYLGEDPDTLDALEFLCLAEGGEVTHYEVLDELAKEVKDKKFASEVASILGKENQHLHFAYSLQGKTAAIDHILLSKYGSIFYHPFNFFGGIGVCHVCQNSIWLKLAAFRFFFYPSFPLRY